MEDYVWLNVFIQLMIFISPLTSYLLFFFKMMCDYINFEFIFLSTLAKKYSHTPLMGLPFCIEILLYEKVRYQFSPSQLSWERMDSEFVWCTQTMLCWILDGIFWVADRIPNILGKKKKGRIILSKIIRCTVSKKTYLFVGSCIKINSFYLVKHLAHKAFLFPNTNVIGLRDAWKPELKSVLKHFYEL